MSIVPAGVVQTINQLRTVLADTVAALPDIPSFAALCQDSPTVAGAFDGIAQVLRTPRLQQPCSGRLDCVLVGAAGHGKNALLAEWFPRLREQGWLPVSEEACQTVCIEYAAADSPALGEAHLESWQASQIKELLNQPDVQARNQQDNIRVSYAEDSVIVDGSEARLPSKERKRWEFPPRFELYPLARSYALSPEQCLDPRFIHALTHRVQPLTTPLLKQNGLSYHALQLRAVLKSCTVKDSFAALAALGLSPDQAAQLRVLDTPALTTESHPRDEILRHCLSHKGQHSLALSWVRDAPDILVHVVKYGQPSPFAALWRTLEQHCGRLDDLAERLIVVVHGVLDPANQPADGRDTEDPAGLEATLLRNLSPHGRVLPAALCFTDARGDRPAAGGSTPAAAYEAFCRGVEHWLRAADETALPLPARLAEQIEHSLRALAEPEDRGQRFMLQQVLRLAMRKGPALLLEKYSLRSGLLAAVRHLRELLEQHYDSTGNFQQAALQAALRRCLASLDGDDPYALERFAAETLDPTIAAIAARYKDGASDPDWVMASFRELGQLLEQILSERGQLPAAEAAAFSRYCHTQLTTWAARWGYAGARLTPPERGLGNSVVLLTHCLQLHGREMLQHLLEQQRCHQAHSLAVQSDADQQRISRLLHDLEQAGTAAEELCRQHGLKL